MAKGRYKDRARGTHGVGLSLQLRWELLDSTAYNVLTATHAQILNDMLRSYQFISHWDTTRVSEGFTYTYSQCGVIVSEKTFYQGIREICRVGFFRCPPEIQENRAAAPYRYIGCTDWMKYKGTSAERKKSRSTWIQRRFDLTRRTGEGLITGLAMGNLRG